MSCTVAPDSDKDKDSNHVEFCKVCAEMGFKEEKIRRLYNGRTINVVDADTLDKHYHKFDKRLWDWEHFEDDGEVARWAKYAS